MLARQDVGIGAILTLTPNILNDIDAMIYAIPIQFIRALMMSPESSHVF
jgi:hypothetical protein